MAKKFRTTSRGRKTAFSFIAFLLFLLLAFFGGELLTRLFGKTGPPDIPDEKSLTYDYHRELGWFPKPNSSKNFTGSRTISVTHNAAGFRDVNHGPKSGKRNDFKYPALGEHWTPEGHEYAADQIFRYLSTHGVLQNQDTTVVKPAM